jgi:hypothetical protein
VIANLWPADDTFTIALMKRMYQHLAEGAKKVQHCDKRNSIFSKNSATRPCRFIGPDSHWSETAQLQSSNLRVGSTP